MNSRLARSAGLIGVATMASRVLGLVRESVLAAIFGAGMQMDAFNVAFRVPNLLRDLFAEGAMTAAFVPAFTRRLTVAGREAAFRLGNLVLNALLVVTLVLVLLGIAVAYPITSLIAPDFASVPGKLELTALLTRVMLPFLTMVAVAAGMMGMLNSLHRFFIPALSPAMFNVAAIACIVGLAPVMPSVGQPAVLAAGQVLLQWPVLRKEGFRYRPLFDFGDPELGHVLRLMVPATVGLAAVQINVFVNTYLATSQEQGAVSWLSYAFRLMYLPIGLFGVSIATAVLPDISRHAAVDDLPALRRTVSGAIRLMLVLNVPATVGLMVLARPIVALLLQRHAFGAADTAATAAALVFYAPGLLGYSTVKIASPAFYSLRDSRTPVIVSVAAVLGNLAVNLALVRVMGFRGLALGTSLAAMFNAGTLLWMLDRRLGGLERRRIVVTFAKIGAAAVIMGLAAAYTSFWTESLLPGERTLGRAVRVFLAIGAGIMALVASARALRIAEFDDAYRRVFGRLFAR